MSLPMTNAQRGISTNQGAISCNDAAWHHAAIPAGSVAVRAYTDQLVYYEFAETDADPAAAGPSLNPGTNHELGCYGAKFVHFKRVSTSASVGWQAVAGCGI